MSILLSMFRRTLFMPHSVAQPNLLVFEVKAIGEEVSLDFTIKRFKISLCHLRWRNMSCESLMNNWLQKINSLNGLVAGLV